ncbi:MAG TPA: phage terminase large subunit [Candidatus Acidoferrales bacterium]|nr:phage terminase large subunit [Candidatus Acidoferrales bacterium]
MRSESGPSGGTAERAEFTTTRGAEDSGSVTRSVGQRLLANVREYRYDSRTVGASEEGERKIRRLIESYTPFARQREFHESGAKYRLFGGAAGPGKTKALLWEAIRIANANDGVDTLLLRKTFPELEATLLTYFRRDVKREAYRSYNEAKHIVTWLNGSTTRFGHCANEGDIYQYQGAEYVFIGIDELTHFTLKQWQFLTSRNRCSVPGTTPRMAGATNPGNVGHTWVKALWIDKRAPAGMDRPEQYDASDYAFIRATIADNPIYANDANYRRALEALPTHLRQMFLLGEWDVFAGQYFDAFDRGKHTPRAETMRLEPWWPRWISIDWGFEHPSAVLWHVTAPAAAERPDGLTITYRELVQNRLSPRMLAAAIAERSKGEKISAVYLSPDAFAQRTADDTIAEQLGQGLALENLPRPDFADDDRVGGWMLMYDLLRLGKWVITDNCTELIETLPILTRSEKNVEDVRKMDGDDAADAARYGLKSRMGPAVIPAAVRNMERITAEEPTSRAIWLRGIEEEEKKRVRGVRMPKRWRF